MKFTRHQSKKEIQKHQNTNKDATFNHVVDRLPADEETTQHGLVGILVGHQAIVPDEVVGHDEHVQVVC